MKRSLIQSGVSLVFVIPREWARDRRLKKQSVVAFTEDKEKGVIVLKPSKQVVLRSVQGLGPKSLSVSLPSEWIEKRKLSAGDFIEVKMTRSSLRIKAARKKRKQL